MFITSLKQLFKRMLHESKITGSSDPFIRKYKLDDPEISDILKELYANKYNKIPVTNFQSEIDTFVEDFLDEIRSIIEKYLPDFDIENETLFSVRVSGSEVKLNRTVGNTCAEYSKEIALSSSSTNPSVTFRSKLFKVILGNGSTERKIPTSVLEGWVVEGFNRTNSGRYNELRFYDTIESESWKKSTKSTITVLKNWLDNISNKNDNSKTYRAERVDKNNEIGNLYEQILNAYTKLSEYENRNIIDPADIIVYKKSKKRTLLNQLNRILNNPETHKPLFMDLHINYDIVGISLKKVKSSSIKVTEKNYIEFNKRNNQVRINKNSLELKFSKNNNGLLLKGVYSINQPMSDDGIDNNTGNQPKEFIINIRNFGGKQSFADKWDGKRDEKPILGVDFVTKGKIAITGKLPIGWFRKEFPILKMDKEYNHISQPLNDLVDKDKNKEYNKFFDPDFVGKMVLLSLREAEECLPFVEIS